MKKLLIVLTMATFMFSTTVVFAAGPADCPNPSCPIGDGPYGPGPNEDGPNGSCQE